MMRIGGLLRSAWCAPAPGEVWVRSTLRSPFSSGSKKKVSCISRAGWPGGKLSAVKL